MRMLVAVLYTIIYLEVQWFLTCLLLSPLKDCTFPSAQKGPATPPNRHYPQGQQLACWVTQDWKCEQEVNLYSLLGSALTARSGPQHHLTWPYTELEQILCFCTILPVAQHQCSGSFPLFCIISHHSAINLYVMAA